MLKPSQKLYEKNDCFECADSDGISNPYASDKVDFQTSQVILLVYGMRPKKTVYADGDDGDDGAVDIRFDILNKNGRRKKVILNVRREDSTSGRPAEVSVVAVRVRRVHVFIYIRLWIYAWVADRARGVFNIFKTEIRFTQPPGTGRRCLQGRDGR